MTYDDRYNRNDRYEDDYQYQDYQDYQYEGRLSRRQSSMAAGPCFTCPERHRGGRNRGLDHS